MFKYLLFKNYLGCRYNWRNMTVPLSLFVVLCFDLWCLLFSLEKSKESHFQS